MLEITTVASQAPAAAHQASVSCNGRLYVHGGVKHTGDSKPHSTLWWFDPNTAHWAVLNEEGPELSHHGAFVSDQRYLNFIGGWTGKARSSEIAIFDTRHECWLPNAVVSGFPVGGGLSSHTVTSLDNGVLVIGRLGGLRTQRKTSAVLVLTGNHETGFKYQVKEKQVLSRSGHTTTINKDGKGVILGGRYEPHRGMDSETLTLPSLKFHPLQSITNLRNAVEKVADATGKAMVASRRYHIAMADTSGKILIHGGEDYRNSFSKDPMNDFAVLSAEGKHLNWYNVNSENQSEKGLHLAGHSALASDGSLFLVGGFGTDWKPNTNTYKITLRD